MTYSPKFQEEFSAKIPALCLLTNLGWQYLSPQAALAARGGKTNEVVLKDLLRTQLTKRRFKAGNDEYALSSNTIEQLIFEVCSPALNEGLAAANEKLYNHMLYGIAVTEFVAGKRVSPTVALIDWANPDNNNFTYSEEFSVARTNASDNRRPDIVCFINGLPLAIIEAKRPNGSLSKQATVDEGVSQHIRNQRHDEIPQLYAYSQLLVAINGIDGKYATTETKPTFWSSWKEEDITDLEYARVKNRVLTIPEKNALFSPREPSVLQWYEQLIAGGELAVTTQDKLMVSLLTPKRLLEIVRLFVLFDKKVGKIIARHHQFFGIKRLIERLNVRDSKGVRQGGVVWHTTGSGKSFTMVLLSKAMILHDSLKNCRLVIVTDRTDLETQLSRTFASSGELSSKKDISDARTDSGRNLAKKISSGRERIIFTIINKFGTAVKSTECYNDSHDLIVLIDEGHRTQNGENHARMRQALPNAAFVAFTGTPLLKDDKTASKFGGIVHAYTMQRAVDDQAVTPLLYEERITDLEVNDRAIDAWFERITLGLSEQQTTDLKKKFAKKGEVYKSEDRIRLIAYDIADHFNKNIAEGLKGQLATDSKLSAVLYKQFLDEAGLNAAIVISAPDTREGNTDIDESGIPQVAKWWKENVGNLDETDYTKGVISRFDKDDDLKLIIVVDKLLTGFDEPKNTVLYIDKPLKEHNLIQAIARVNRLHPLKNFGLLIDYRGILPQLDTTIGKYQDLANRTQGGFSINDIEGLYSQMSTEYKKLPNLHSKVWDFFKAVKNKGDFEQLRQVLVPKLQEVDNETLDINQKTRDDFYEAVSDFTACLNIAMQSADFFKDNAFTEEAKRRYKEDLKAFTSLRQMVKRDAGEAVDYGLYAAQIRKLMDKHVVGVGVREPEGVYEVNKMGVGEKPEDWTAEKTRNETDIIRTRIAKKIEQNLEDDPYAKEMFSQLLRKAIQDAEALFEHPLKQYLLFKEFEQKVDHKTLDDLPARFSHNKQAQAYFGVFKQAMPEHFNMRLNDELNSWVDLAFEVDKSISNAVAMHSINPQNIEAEIRKVLLPAIFNVCKTAGAGMDHAISIVTTIVHITRIGLNHHG